jgi:hypothetical protein
MGQPGWDFHALSGDRNEQYAVTTTARRQQPDLYGSLPDEGLYFKDQGEKSG